MDKQKYNNYPLTISQILGLIEANDIVIPEIQRPFVGCINDGGWHFADGHGCGAGPVMGYGPVVTRDRVDARPCVYYDTNDQTIPWKTAKSMDVNNFPIINVVQCFVFNNKMKTHQNA